MFQFKKKKDQNYRLNKINELKLHLNLLFSSLFIFVPCFCRFYLVKQKNELRS